jgi:hypothetical protein
MVVVAISIRSARHTLHTLVFPPFLSKKERKCRLCRTAESRRRAPSCHTPSQTRLVAIVAHIEQGKATLKDDLIELNEDEERLL